MKRKTHRTVTEFHEKIIKAHDAWVVPWTVRIEENIPTGSFGEYVSVFAAIASFEVGRVVLGGGDVYRILGYIRGEIPRKILANYEGSIFGKVHCFGTISAELKVKSEKDEVGNPVPIHEWKCQVVINENEEDDPIIAHNRVKVTHDRWNCLFASGNTIDGRVEVWERVDHPTVLVPHDEMTSVEMDEQLAILKRDSTTSALVQVNKAVKRDRQTRELEVSAEVDARVNGSPEPWEDHPEKTGEEVVAEISAVWGDDNTPVPITDADLDEANAVKKAANVVENFGKLGAPKADASKLEDITRQATEDFVQIEDNVIVKEKDFKSK